MTVYILHFDSPLAHAKHYTGYSADVVGRIMEHMEGTSKARIMEVLHERGIKFALARTFDGADRHFERRLKNTHNVRVYCPICMGDKVREFFPVEEKDGTANVCNRNKSERPGERARHRAYPDRSDRPQPIPDTPA